MSDKQLVLYYRRLLCTMMVLAEDTTQKATHAVCDDIQTSEGKDLANLFYAETYKVYRAMRMAAEELAQDRGLQSPPKLSIVKCLPSDVSDPKDMN